MSCILFVIQRPRSSETHSGLTGAFVAAHLKADDRLTGVHFFTGPFSNFFLRYFDGEIALDVGHEKQFLNVFRRESGSETLSKKGFYFIVF